MDAENASILHTLPTCKRYNAVDLNRPDCLSEFIADCRKALAPTSPS